MTVKLRIALADDHHLIRSGLKLLLDSNETLSIVGEASDGASALLLVEQLQPDILLLDLAMPGMDGLECLRELQRRNLPTRVIVLTMFEDENYVLAAMSAGAQGYVQKSAIDTELFQAIENVAAGRLHLNEKSAKSLLSMLLVERQQVVAPPMAAVLSPREQEVLRWYAHGFSLREIGEQLGLSVKTVDTYKTRIMEKLGFQKKSELIAYAAKQGLFEP
ncbi:MAG: response regulator transcription factor [Negativicutes bacterium]|nr:response regulator transcription factor [Negativicutes bacterium]